MIEYKKKQSFHNKKIAKNFSLSFIFIGILGIFFLDKLIEVFLLSNDMSKQSPLNIGILFIIFMGIILYFLLNHMQKIILNIEKSYNELKLEEQDRLLPYEFALNNSVDAIYLFTLEAKIVYVNQAACDMVGYLKEEMLDMFLEDMDPNFDRNSAQSCMLEIKNSKYWRIETTQKKKDETIFPIEVSGHGFIYSGTDYICAFGRDMSQKQEYRNKITIINSQLKKSLDEKEILLKEIHHRVKNNMEIVSSLLNMQARRSSDTQFKDSMKKSCSRIHTMALVHEFLYLGENLAYINFPHYIKKLVYDIKDIYIGQNIKINIFLDIEKLIVSTNKCIEIGMVLHELCVNSLKYACDEDKDNILSIKMNIINEFIHIKIKDNGIGIKDIKSLYKCNSIGMQLIHAIVQDQLDGNVEFYNNNGLECNINFLKKELFNG